jgi:hypothetical protein
MTSFSGEAAASSGYGSGSLLGHGFPRYGADCERTLIVQGRELKLVANLAAGGVISELWWNGKQFINGHDYGRQIQTAFNLTNRGEENNPTEAGDMYGCPGGAAPGWAHGSPLLAASVRGKTLETACHPLQWKPANFGGGRGNPVMWRGTISKRVDLEVRGIPNVLQWTTTVEFPSDEPYVDLEIVTAYLNSEFTNFFAYDAAADTVAELTSLVPNGACTDPTEDARLRPRAGGVILSTADGAYALGIYRSEPDNLFGLCKFLGFGGTGKYGFSTTKWNALWRRQNLKAGRYSFTSYLIVGTLPQVLEDARRLYRHKL